MYFLLTNSMAHIVEVNILCTLFADGQVLIPVESSSIHAHANILSEFLACALADTCSQVQFRDFIWLLYYF